MATNPEPADLPLITTKLRTVGELDALPAGAVIRDCDGDTAVKTLRGSWHYRLPHRDVFLPSDGVLRVFSPIFLVSMPPRVQGQVIEVTATA